MNRILPLLVVSILVLSGLGAVALPENIEIINAKNKQPSILSNYNDGLAQGVRSDIVWDNGMEDDAIVIAIEDDQYPIYAECADDFRFDTLTEVCDVHWIGGYWKGVGYNSCHWPWKITFYNDDNNKPGSVYLGPFEYNNSEYTETFIKDLGQEYGNRYEFSVDLPENYEFPGDQKFWISIKGVGSFPPQSGWACHFGPGKLHEAVFKSAYFGYPDWTDTSIAMGTSLHMCFQLTTKPIGSICCEPGITHWTEIKTGANVTGTFNVNNCGEDNSTLNWEVYSYPNWMSDIVFTPNNGSIVAPSDGTDVTFTFTAPAEQNSDFSGSIKLINKENASNICMMHTTLTTPKNKPFINNFSLLSWFFEWFPNLFPIMRQMMGL
jgi:hypothetical protein